MQLRYLPEKSGQYFLLVFCCLNLALTIIPTAAIGAVKTWTGSAGDGQWSSADNWNDQSIPQPGDDIILDNGTFAGGYSVTLPDNLVTVRTLSINPSTGNNIEFIIPATNISNPAFSATGPGYAVVIESGGIFRNASGLTSGISLLIADSIKILSGGRYVHNTRSVHATNIVQVLSKAPGTEKGIFEFDVPSAASYTVSASNRTFGTLIFSSIASGGNKTYACNGSNTLTVNGDLQVGDGVHFNVDLGGVNGNVVIKNDFIQNGGMFNIASGTGNQTIVRIGGNISQAAGALITASALAFPTIELNGTQTQQINLAGTILNNIDFKMNNNAGGILAKALSLSYKLELENGSLHTDANNLLTLQNNCSIIADSTNSNSYIEGPVRKSGLQQGDHFLFPVGKNGLFRWLELKNATGDFTVEYFRQNPGDLSGNVGPGINHISSTEYWTITSGNGANANIELSFDQSSGGVTDLNSLRIAALSGGSWTDAGHIAVTGIAGQEGSITSNNFAGFTNSPLYFTLAGSQAFENPLPIELLEFSGMLNDKKIHLHWKVAEPFLIDHFDIMYSGTGIEFSKIAVVQAQDQLLNYEYNGTAPVSQNNYYRLKMVEKTGQSHLGNIVCLSPVTAGKFSIRISPTAAVNGFANVIIQSQEHSSLELSIVNSIGLQMQHANYAVVSGMNLFSINISWLPAGVYQVIAINNKKEYIISRFVKQ